MIEMIDVGGPVAAARRGEELRPRRRRLPPGAVRPRPRRAPRRARSPPRPAARSPRRPSRSRPPTTRRSRAGSPRTQFFPDQLTLTFRKITDLAYGENPHQTAAYYEEVGSRKHLLSRVNQLGGRELSYNNLADLEAARRIVREFDAAGGRDRQAREPLRGRGRRDDRGGLRARPRRRPGLGVRLRAAAQPAGRRPSSGGRIAEHFVEVVVGARVRRRGARRARARSRRCASCATASAAPTPRASATTSASSAACSSRSATAEIDEREGMEVVAGDRRRGAVGRPRLRLARLQARQLERDRARQGRPDDRDRRRPDEPRRRGPDRDREGARSSATTPAGSVLASDAFFPFADGPQLALDGRRHRRSSSPAARSATTEVVAAVGEAGAAMVFTGRRHFRH